MPDFDREGYEGREEKTKIGLINAAPFGFLP